MTIRIPWKDLAPSPFELGEGLEWHVFLSYRSVNRWWAIALYDLLTGLGYRVFMDKGVLKAGDPLEERIEQGLRRSQTGVVLWTTSNRESEWCLAELQVMRNLSKSGAFRYVIGRLDRSDLPILERGKLFVDFSETREGPGGLGLLELLYSLHDSSLPIRVIKQATAIDKEIEQEKHRLAAADRDGDAALLLRQSDERPASWCASPALPARAAQSLVFMDRLDDAVDLIDKWLDVFPWSVHLKQVKAIGFLMRHRWREAQRIVGPLIKEGIEDAETLMIDGWAWSERFKEDGKLRYLEASQQAHAAAFRRHPDHYYPGFNAAVKTAMLGRQEEAKQIAQEVEHLLESEALQSFWEHAARGITSLILGNTDDAVARLRGAVVRFPEHRGLHRDTLDELKRLYKPLALPEAARKAIEAAFEE